jgi:phosphoesterase RecJ-like protein
MNAPAQNWSRVEDVTGEIRGVIDRAERLAVLAHKDADADSLGSALAFATSLRALGRTVNVVVPDPLPTLLAYLPGYETVEPAETGIDVLFTFDCATIQRFGDQRGLVESTPTVVNVDHHIGNDGFGTINLVETDASATGQVVYRLLRALDAPITPEVATDLYAALFTDTGGFRHENTNEAALRLGADLVALGADPGFVALKSYKSRSFAQMKLEGLSIAAMRTDLEGTLVWSAVTQEMLREAGAAMEESEGVIDALQSIDTMKVAVFFREISDSLTRISVRTRDEYEAPAFCKPFGGGGHRRAAGAEIEEPLVQATETVLRLVRSLMGAAGS